MGIMKKRGLVLEVSSVQVFGPNQEFRKQHIILFVPGDVCPFTYEKVSNDEKYCIELYNDIIDRFKIDDKLKGKQVEVEIKLRGVEFTRKDGKGSGYAIKPTLRRITRINQHVIQLPPLVHALGDNQ